ncbi:autotransporter secretion outer membrane protein TamA [Lonepinella koalarum]|uniref:Translocation and assembly module subunit TamA n=2 Tax=Lonepinella koalarum TaxID=53417 RepID=A0A4R1L079_9PAST|nr:autotransporter secretion outer membrane protein TamA [Lonepinella koalarum]
MKFSKQLPSLLVLSYVVGYPLMTLAEQGDSAQNAPPEMAQNVVTPTVKVRLQGIQDGKLKENAQIYINEISAEESDGSERHQELVRTALYKGLRVLGYYDFQLNFSLAPNGKELIANVELGNPVRIEQTDVQIEGDAKKDEAFLALNKDLPKKGDIVNHESYDDYKSAVQKLAVQRGYFDADFSIHRLEVMPSTYQAWWRLLFESGARYRYGEFRFKNAQIREDYLRNMLNLQQGEPYLLNDVLQANNDYTSTGWFQSVLMKPTLNEENKTVDFDVLMYPKKKNSMEVGIGYSSDVGPRLQLGWKKPWINNRGHSFSSSFYVSEPKQTIEMAYKMPRLRSPLYEYYQFSTGIENEDDSSTDTKSTAITFGALRYWDHPSGWQYSWGVRTRYDKFTQADVKDKTFLLYPTGSISHKYLQGGLFPTWAHSISLTADWGTKALLSDVNFLSLRASGAVIKTFAENHRVVSRLDIGWLHTDDLHRMPPAMRFFAGGDRSVRGYGYKKISPKDSNGKLIGASRLATGSLEYQYQVYPSWWLATFYDAGLAANSYSTDELRYGAGVGVRWASPVGAIKFDIATPVRDKDDSKNIQFYIGLGAEI